MGILRGRSGEIVEMRSVDTYCIQETIFRETVRIISGNEADYKLFWIGNKKGLGRGFLDQKIGR